jgi:hypothetical protein
VGFRDFNGLAEPFFNEPNLHPYYSNVATSVSWRNIFIRTSAQFEIKKGPFLGHGTGL